MNTTADQISSAIRFLERIDSGLVRVRSSAAQRIGLSPVRVKTLIEQSRRLSPEEVKRAMARQVKPGTCGRGGLPRYVIELMYADYKRLNSLAEVGKLHGRSRQSMYQIFVSHGLQLNEKKLQKPISYRGRNYTPGKDGYYRATSGDRKQLHYAIWEDANGPVPDGSQVTFKNANRRDFRPENLACMPIREVTLFHHSRHIQPKQTNINNYHVLSKQSLPHRESHA